MEQAKKKIRHYLTHFAGFINYWTRGKIKPAHITTVSLLGHIPVAWALATSHPRLAALLLAVFASLDALDGALARAQGTSSSTGTFYDAVSDRMKEIITFSALAVFAYNHLDLTAVWQVVAVAGTSLLVSFVKAKGEMAVAAHGPRDVQKLNRLFGIGIAGYEVRVIVLVLALALGIIEFVLPLLLAANLLTVALRFIVISRELYQLDQPEPKKPDDKD